MAQVLLTRLAVGITDWLSFGLIFPYALKQETRLNLDWRSGDFIPEFNREMSEDDFWDWASGLGQPKPKDWSDSGRPGDVILALLANVVREDWVQITFLTFGNTFTGEAADPEQLGAVGTSGFDFITNGDLGFHLLSDWRLPERGWLVFRLLYTDGCEVGEVADALQVTAQVVYNWRFRIRKEAEAFLAAAEVSP